MIKVEDIYWPLNQTPGELWVEKKDEEKSEKWYNQNQVCMFYDVPKFSIYIEYLIFFSS